ncbi:MAG TPA: stage V sporulation protein AD [Candidatus Scatosoma pullicola]|nr:stage V sporulation protein AD [Candidatus Scatosoma pullicola]
MSAHTVLFRQKPRIISTGTVAGPKECAGVVGKYVDKALSDDMFGESTYEKAECKMLAYAIGKAIENADISEKDIDMMISGDLLNQIISASFAARDFDFPFLGVYGACSTMAESLALAAAFIDAGYFNRIVAATGSHFSSAERQYRYPLELGNTRPPQSQWTVTGAGGAVVAKSGGGVAITAATFGKVVDFGISDVNNMGAAMAPAACNTILTHLKDTGRAPDYYDLIVTGDLGALGSRIVKDLTWEKGVDIQPNHVDCGEIVYNVIEDEFQGGSGAGCSAVVFNSYLMDKLRRREINRVLFAATGALLSTVSSGQGESIPCICHAVSVENVF